MNQELLIKWSADTRELYGCRLYDKAAKLVDHNCIHYISDKHFFEGEGRAYVCLPLNQDDHFIFNDYTFKKNPLLDKYGQPVFYNKTAYQITVTYKADLYRAFGNGNFLKCACQGWKSKDDKGGDFHGVNCCHCIALKMFWKRKVLGGDTD